MEEIEEGCVEKHYDGFEDPKEYLVLIDCAVPTLDVLHQAIYTTDCDDGGRDVKDVQDHS